MSSSFNPPDTTTSDVLNHLAGLTPDSPIAALRARREDVAGYIQASYDALLEPEQAGGLSLVERTLAALRVATLTESGELVEYYRQRLRQLGRSPDEISAAESFSANSGFSRREAAILQHTDLLTLEPGAANQSHLAELRAAGLSVREVVTLAQLVAFLSFQIRLFAVIKQGKVVL